MAEWWIRSKNGDGVEQESTMLLSGFLCGIFVMGYYLRYMKASENMNPPAKGMHSLLKVVMAGTAVVAAVLVASSCTYDVFGVGVAGIFAAVFASALVMAVSGYAGALTIKTHVAVISAVAVALYPIAGWWTWLLVLAPSIAALATARTVRISITSTRSKLSSAISPKRIVYGCFCVLIAFTFGLSVLGMLWQFVSLSFTSVSGYDQSFHIDAGSDWTFVHEAESHCVVIMKRDDYRGRITLKTKRPGKLKSRRMGSFTLDPDGYKVPLGAGAGIGNPLSFAVLAKNYRQTKIATPKGMVSLDPSMFPIADENAVPFELIHRVEDPHGVVRLFRMPNEESPFIPPGPWNQALIRRVRLQEGTKLFVGLEVTKELKAALSGTQYWKFKVREVD